VTKPRGKGGARHLDDDEAADWSHTARSVQPLKKSKGRVHPADDMEAPARPRKVAHMHVSAGKAEKHVAKPAAAAAKPAVPPMAEFDRKKAKRLRSGRIEIEARIDLHGMRQHEAHDALRGFLHRSHHRGLRWVLVITGKGRFAKDADVDAPFEMGHSRDRGVLKRNVPHWLEEADLRTIIVSFTTAAASHGGEGALYIHLRKRG